MTPRELETLLYYGKKALNWLFVLVLAGFILWAAAPRLAILDFIVLGIFVLFVAGEGWKAYRKARPPSAPTPGQKGNDTGRPTDATALDKAGEHRG